MAILFALVKAAKIGELCKLSTRAMKFLSDGVEFELTEPTKTQHSGGPKKFFVPSLPDDAILCPVRCLQQYLSVTRSDRAQQSALLLSMRPPHQPVSSSTVARWVTTVMHKAGVEETFSAHSTRGASSTAARTHGVTLADILATADWSQENTFIRHYYRDRPASSGAFSRAVLCDSS